MHVSLKSPHSSHFPPLPLASICVCVPQLYPLHLCLVPILYMCCKASTHARILNHLSIVGTPPGETKFADNSKISFQARVSFFFMSKPLTRTGSKPMSQCKWVRTVPVQYMNTCQLGRALGEPVGLGHHCPLPAWEILAGPGTASPGKASTGREGLSLSSFSGETNQQGAQSREPGGWL